MWWLLKKNEFLWEQLLLVTHWRSVGRCSWHTAQWPCLSLTECAGPTLSSDHWTLRTGLCRSNTLVHSDQLIWERALLLWRSAGCLIDHGTDHLVWVHSLSVLVQAPLDHVFGTGSVQNQEPQTLNLTNCRINLTLKYFFKSKFQ